MGYNYLMALNQRLEHSQKPIFTQSLRQSVKLLELPLLELKNTIEAEIIENPVIEEVQASSQDIAPSPAQDSREDETSLASLDREIAPRELDNYEKPIPGKKESLADVLLRQLRINAKEERQIKIGTIVIHHIDENGYLRDELSSLCAEAECSEEELLDTLKLIQTFDPAGVGAQDVKECLLIQLEKSGNTDPLCRKVVEEYLQDLAGKDMNHLCRKLKCSEEELKTCVAKIRRLEPKPGRTYSSDETAYVIPDISIEEKDGELTISTRDDTLPTIRVNPLYKNMLKSKKVNEETKNFIREKLRNANNLIRAIYQRKDTLTRVISIIAETQKEALLDGMEKLKPLTLKEIAQRVGMHESTISRIVMNKYVQTPTEIFALRDFFSTSLKTETGEDVSSQSIKLKIKELVDSEDKAKPLRDQEIADLLKESEKTPIARRTVAKYREMLKVPPASRRRRSI